MKHRLIHIAAVITYYGLIAVTFSGTMLLILAALAYRFGNVSGTTCILIAILGSLLAVIGSAILIKLEE